MASKPGLDAFEGSTHSLEDIVEEMPTSGGLPDLLSLRSFSSLRCLRLLVPRRIMSHNGFLILFQETRGRQCGVVEKSKGTGFET